MTPPIKNVFKIAFMALAFFAPVKAHGSDCVVLLHGLSMGNWHMADLEEKLADAGYNVTNIDYRSRREDVPQIVEHQIKDNLPTCSTPTHFVGHSLGGLVIRELLSQWRPEKMGRVVLLGTPNGGSEVSDFVQKLPLLGQLFSWVFGPALPTLQAEDNTYLASLPTPDYPVGAVAGTLFIDPIGGAFVLPGPNDGKVTVKSTKVKNMADHLVMEVTHTGMPFNDDVIYQVQYFLERGRFNHKQAQDG